MKNLKKLFTSFIAIITVVSCGDPELPVELFPEMQYGAYARKMSQTGEFNYYDITSSKIDIHVEYYDEAKGANVAQYDIDVEYVDLVGKGAGSKARTSLKSITSSEFTVNADGYLSSDISLGFSEALTALGLTAEQVTGGNYFRYWFTITKTDGSVYDYNNTGSQLMGSTAFGALFRLNVNIICPSSLEGEILVDQTTESWDGSFPGWTGFELDQKTMNLVKSGADNVYKVPEDAAWGSWIDLWGDVSTGPVVNDACNILSMSGSDQYGDSYFLIEGTVSVSGDGKVLSFQWGNTYGEGGFVDVAYKDGSSWPDLKN
jgi:hypothetical protein